jgi:2-iminobutanoate/2-iminopropanoate deaminase
MDRRVQRFNFGLPWEESHGYSQGLRVGNRVHIAGQTPHSIDGLLIGQGDPAEQARATFKNLDRVLAGFGASRSQIVEDTIMIVRLSENFEAISKVHREYFDAHRPASTVLGVSDLVFPAQIVEISVCVNLDLSR